MDKGQVKGKKPVIPVSLLRQIIGFLPIRLPFLPPPFLGPAIATYLGAMVVWWRPTLRTVPIAMFVFCLFSYLVIRWPGRMAAPIMCFCFLCSASHQFLVIQNGQESQQRLAGGIREVTASVQRAAEPTDGEWGRVQVRLSDRSLVQLSGKVLHLLPGQKIRFDARFSIPQPRRNPGGFDEATYLARNGVFLKADLVLNRIEIIDPSPNPVDMAVRKTRSAIAAAAAKLVPAKQAALLAGILIGDTSRMDPDEQQTFQKSGLSHLMAVSGANVTFILIPAAFLLHRTMRGRRIRSGFMIIFLIAFAFLTGWEPSVTRAILMIGLMLVGNLFHKRSDPMNALLFACTVMLLTNPLLAIATSFHLSVLATAGILLLSHSLDQWMMHWFAFMPKLVRQILVINLAVQIAVLPLQTIISGQLSPVAIIANLPAMPLAEGATLLGALAIMVIMPFAALNPQASSLIGWPVRILLQALSDLAALFASPTWPRIMTGTLSTLTIIAYLFLVIGFLLSTQTRRRFHQAAALLLAASLLIDGFAYVGRPSLEVMILDVGQGDCTLIRSRGGTVTLIDAGSESAGLKDVRPVLQALGIRSVDQAILTHGHSDHAGGFVKLLADGMIERIYVPYEAMQLSLYGENKAADGYETDLMDQVLAQAKFRDIPVQPIRKNDTIPIDQTALLRVLTTTAADLSEIDLDELAGIAKKRGANAFNLVFRLATADWSIVLTGDCDPESEMALLNDPLLDANLLRVAHHGSATATGQALIDAVSPDLALISVGKNNYGHPSLAVLDRLAFRQIPVARTDRQGAITIRVYPGRYSVKTMLQVKPMQ